MTEDCKQDLNESEMAILPNDSSDLVKIDFSEFTSNVTDISKYLGNTITVYYEQLTDKDDRKLIIIDDETTKNSEIKLDYEDLNSFSGNSLKYYDSSSKIKTVKLKEDELTVRYNGKLVEKNETVTLQIRQQSRKKHSHVKRHLNNGLLLTQTTQSTVTLNLQTAVTTAQ